MDEPIEMPFGAWTWVGPRNHVYVYAPNPHMGTGSSDAACRCQYCSGLIKSSNGPTKNNIDFLRRSHHYPVAATASYRKFVAL